MRKESLEGYTFRSGKGQDENGNTITALQFISPDLQHIVEMILNEDARIELVAKLTGGIQPVKSLSHINGKEM